MARPAGPAIAVGVDGAKASRRALHWATSEAMRQRATLLVIHARPAHPPVAVGNDPELLTAARRILDAAVSEARDIAGGLVPVRAMFVIGTPGAVLVDHSQQCSLLVVGTRGHGRLTDFIIGSTAIHVSAHAHCPVVTVPRRDTIPADGSAGRIVVGINSPDSTHPALTLAVDQARGRNLPLRVVYAVSLPNTYTPYGEPTIDVAQRDRMRHEAASELDRALVPWRDRYRNLLVEERVVLRPPVRALAKESVGADALVLGSRGRDERTGLLGSVSQAALRRARCPVIVARDALAPTVPGDRNAGV